MHYFPWIAGAILALAWFSRIVDAAIGMPSVADISAAAWDRNSGGSSASSSSIPRVSIIVPARNEERDIEASLTSLLELDYDNYEVIAVNDRSADRTGEIMERVAAHFSHKTREMGHPSLFERQLRVIHHRELPAGWLGKTHAMWTAANAATGEWLLFTDADVLFRPDSLRRAMAYAEAENADLGVSEGQRSGTGGGGATNITLGNSIDLRGLSPYATLTLLDGHRVPPAGTSGSTVDPDSFPSIMLQRGGHRCRWRLGDLRFRRHHRASANLILRRDVEGVEIERPRRLGGRTTRSGASACSSATTGEAAGGSVSDNENSYHSDLNGQNQSFFESNQTGSGGRFTTAGAQSGSGDAW